MDLEFLTLDETAAKFHVSRRWLREFLRGKSIGRRIGRDMIFSQADVMEIYRRLPECRLSSVTQSRAKPRITGYADRTSECELIEARELLTKRSQEKSLKRSSGKLRTTSNVVAMSPLDRRLPGR